MTVASRAMCGAFLMADPGLMEPIYRVDITGARGNLNEAYSVLRQRNGRIVDTSSTSETLDAIQVRVPVRCASGLPVVLRLATHGHAHSSCTFDGMEMVSMKEENSIIPEARKRKNLREQIGCEYSCVLLKRLGGGLPITTLEIACSVYINLFTIMMACSKRGY